MDGKEVREPVPGVVHTGLIVQSRAAVSEDRNRVALELQYQFGDVRRPILTANVEGIPIALPEVSLRQGSASLDVPRDEWALAGAFVPTHPMKETKILLVKAEILSAKR